MPWEQMDHAARLAHMTAVVEPKMKQSFQAHDAERFADFGCATCHGPGVEDGTYAMPNPELPVLGRAAYRQDYAKNSREMVRFMWEHVEIETAALLGQKTGRTRFSCRSCHVRE